MEIRLRVKLVYMTNEDLFGKLLKKCLHKFENLTFLINLYDNHTCDTFLNPNREIWNFWSGNLCLVSGGFHVANFGLFLPKLKSRNLVTLLEICFRASQCLHICQPK